MDSIGMISVCMATYNGEKYIKQQVESILCQLSANDEIIVSDDGSKDDTLGIIKSLNDPRIHIYINEGKHGFVGNFNNAFLHAKGDYIFLSDQDDYWLPGKVKTVMGYLTNGIDLVTHNADLVDGEGRYLGSDYFSHLHSKTGFWANMWKTRFLGCCMCFNRKVLDKCMPMPKHIVAHDYWIGMMALKHFNVKFIDDKLLCYRRHGGNVSPSSEKSNESWWYRIVEKRGYLLWKIMFR